MHPVSIWFVAMENLKSHFCTHGWLETNTVCLRTTQAYWID
ncbi:MULTISPECIES: hypothetical protein [unclassified Microcoleus]|nr:MULTISPECIES: hypothetical protein [unclassified Microcoleus]